MTDAELLRRFEPILRFTRGELFFPLDAERYVAECDLWQGRSQRDARRIVEHGELSPERLAGLTAAPGERLFLRFVQRPLSGAELARWRARPDRPRFHAAARLARVGLLARVIDAGFNLSLLVRGTVPGGTALAAWAKYREIAARDPRLACYGRVVREHGWIVLHYLFFFAMNDWRTTFGGANDHEADWEQAFVYLEDRPEGPRPVWCAAAAHDTEGPDMRRRWDDPLLHRMGEHPVLFPAVGSHGIYFEPGEYIAAAPVPGHRALRGLLEALRALWRDVLRQADPGDLGERLEAWLTIPFIDYARGDGRAIGYGEAESWTLLPIGDDLPWVAAYRGLFGLDTYDRFAGERAPAGPKFRRDGGVRRSWYDPLGWAGLAQVAPPFLAATALRRHIALLHSERERVRHEERERSARLPGLQLELEGLQHGAAPARTRTETAEAVARAESELGGTRRELAELDDRIEGAERELARVERGDFGGPREHLRKPYRPVAPEVKPYGMLVELWSALGVSVLLLTVVGLEFLTNLGAAGAITLAIGISVVLEAALRRRLLRLLLRATLALAVISAAILVWEFAVPLAVFVVVGIAVLTLADNVRELRGR